jgi:site-specific recombinase XerD
MLNHSAKGYVFRGQGQAASGLARIGSPLCRRNLLNRQLKPTAEKLKLDGVTWHWLRHVNATLLDSVGASPGTLQALLGHATDISAIYVHCDWTEMNPSSGMAGTVN